MALPDVAVTRDRVSAWIAASDLPKATIAAMAKVDEKTVRQAAASGWNPTVNTLAKLAALIPLDWSSPEFDAGPAHAGIGRAAQCDDVAPTTSGVGSESTVNS